jgi:hypothetical protein
METSHAPVSRAHARRAPPGEAIADRTTPRTPSKAHCPSTVAGGRWGDVGAAATQLDYIVGSEDAIAGNVGGWLLAVNVESATAQEVVRPLRPWRDGTSKPGHGTSRRRDCRTSQTAERRRLPNGADCQTAQNAKLRLSNGANTETAPMQRSRRETRGFVPAPSERRRPAFRALWHSAPSGISRSSAFRAF